MFELGVVCELPALDPAKSLGLNTCGAKMRESVQGEGSAMMAPGGGFNKDQHYSAFQKVLSKILQKQKFKINLRGQTVALGTKCA